jgi:hypothetical protein
MTRVAIGIAVLSAGLWLVAVPAAPQGRGQGGGPGGAPGLSGSHAPLGAPGSEGVGSSGHGRSAANNAGAAGPKSPAELLDQNTHLSKNLAAFFPAGTNLTAEASGFKNLGQFVSAVHVSHNLGIPFDQLKCTELGTLKAASIGMTCPAAVTNTKGMSLGKSIQTIKPDADSNEAVQQATRQAKKDSDE